MPERSSLIEEEENDEEEEEEVEEEEEEQEEEAALAGFLGAGVGQLGPTAKPRSLGAFPAPPRAKSRDGEQFELVEDDVITHSLTPYLGNRATC